MISKVVVFFKILNPPPPPPNFCTQFYLKSIQKLGFFFGRFWKKPTFEYQKYNIPNIKSWGFFFKILDGLISTFYMYMVFFFFFFFFLITVDILTMLKKFLESFLSFSRFEDDLISRLLFQTLYQDVRDYNLTW